jgi:hypothetical protein
VLSCEKDDDSSTDVEQWTPALSDYESATDEGSEQHLEFSEYRLHTNSPAWAALFPLPDSPESVTVALPEKDPDVRIVCLYLRRDWLTVNVGRTSLGFVMHGLHTTENTE